MKRDNMKRDAEINMNTIFTGYTVTYSPNFDANHDINAQLE